VNLPNQMISNHVYLDELLGLVSKHWQPDSRE